MAEKGWPLTVFTKPWPKMTLVELAKFVKGLGLNGVELPVRPGFQVEPQSIAKGLPEAVKILKDHGLHIGSVAGNTDEPTIAACGENGVPIIRVCLGVDMNIGYMASEKRIRDQYDKLIPALDKHNVAIGVQNHCDYCIGSAIGIMHLIEKYDPKHVCAVLDMAHCAVDGEPEVMAIDICWSHLRLVNFKSAFHLRTNGPEAVEAQWGVYWSTCHHSGYSWSKAINALKVRGYKGDLCLPAEYNDGNAVVRLLQEDVAYIKFLMAQPAGEVEKRITDWQGRGTK
jgi:sugar phosphate isomerase/epimerase